MRKKASIIALLVLCSLPVFGLLLIFPMGQQDISDRENRTLTHFPELTLSGFVNGTFQDNLEKAIADQYPLGEAVKGAVLDADNAIANAEKRMVTALLPTANQMYMEIAKGYYHFAGDEHRIVEKPWLESQYQEKMAQNALEWNNLQNIHRAVYFIRNSRAQDFTKPDEQNGNAFQAVQDAFNADAYGCFSARDYDDFCKKFYQTDHHWNAQGADEGYRGALSLVSDEHPLMAKASRTFPVIFNGSYARQTKELCADEQFSILEYDTPRALITLNGKKGQYGHAAAYAAGKYPTDELRNHYSYYYGGDYGEIMIDMRQNDKPNLLLIADSYSNPINLQLASHFNKTFIIDLRYFERDMGNPFCLAKYVTEHDIREAMMLGDISLFSGYGQEAD